MALIFRVGKFKMYLL